MMTQDKLELYTADDKITILDALKQINQNAHGILFVVDESLHVIGSVADGDIRRYLLQSEDLSANITEAMCSSPKVLTEEQTDNARELFRSFPFRALPVVDRQGILLDILFSKTGNEIRSEQRQSLAGIPIVIMAGGKGTRLYPFTKILPKPLIPIGDTPILERVIGRFVDFGARDFYLTVNYKKDLIKAYFADLKPDYQISYVEEDKPLGTGGSLKLIDQNWDKPFFVTNCDILIEADYQALYQEHLSKGNDVTIVVSQKTITVPYGVVIPKDDGTVESMEEKPTMTYLINTGMYVVNPEHIDRIPDDTMYHMPTLIEDLMADGLRVGVFPIDEDSFLDMGEFEEMRRMEDRLKV